MTNDREMEMNREHGMSLSYPLPDDGVVHDWSEPQRLVVERLIGEWQEEARREHRDDRGDDAGKRSARAHAVALVGSARRRVARLTRRPAPLGTLPPARPACDRPA